MATTTAAPPPLTSKKRKRLDKASARIVIIGSGLGGLGTAISLNQAGFTNVVVYERDVSVSARREGYGLTLSYNPKGPLAQMEVLEEVANRDCPSRCHYLFRPDGTVMGYFGNAFSSNRGMGQRGNLRIPRQVLRQILMEQLESKITVEFGKRLIGFVAEDDTASKSSSNRASPQLTLRFEDGSMETGVDLLIGADGIRSSVVKHLLPNSQAGLNYLGIFIILGIAEFSHPHLDERGFYTLDGSHRLFTMPYEGSRMSSGNNRRIMWQLSYRLKSHEEALRLSKAGPKALQEEVLNRCVQWHDPVVEMVQSTPLDTIWGTGLMDRDPKELLDQLEDSNNVSKIFNDRVVVLGDAVHSMSPFKGAGANQALMDGPLLASWLQRASLPSALKGFWREMTNRTRPRVLASREAAKLLHSPQVFAMDQDFAGVPKEKVSELLNKLKEENVGAQTGKELDSRIQKVMDELGCQIVSSTVPYESVDSTENAEAQHQALALASKGETQALRNMSMEHSVSIRSALDTHGRTCLHLAAEAGHYTTCRWLVTEAFIPIGLKDGNGTTAIQAAAGKDERIVLLFESLAK